MQSTCTPCTPFMERSSSSGGVKTSVSGSWARSLMDTGRKRRPPVLAELAGKGGAGGRIDGWADRLQRQPFRFFGPRECVGSTRMCEGGQRCSELRWLLYRGVRLRRGGTGTLGCHLEPCIVSTTALGAVLAAMPRP